MATVRIADYYRMNLANKLDKNSRQKFNEVVTHSPLNQIPQLSSDSKTLKFISKGDLIHYRVYRVSTSLTCTSCSNSCLQSFNL